MGAHCHATNRRHRAMLAGIVAVLLLGACNKSSDDARTPPESAEAAIPVEVARTTRSDIYSTYSGTAAVDAYAQATVIAKVGGELRDILVEEGDGVSRGQILARLDGDRLRLEVAQAEANLQKLRRDYQRNLDLKKKSLISAGEFEKIRYEMEALEAAFDMAELELGYTQIRSPIDGVVSKRFVKTGNTIDANAPVFEVTSLDPLIADLHVPEREYRQMSAGMSASVHADAVPDVTFDGEIARVSPVIDPATGTFKITVEISDSTGRLKPGMFTRISIVSDVQANALQIPRSAIVENESGPTVFVAENDSVERRAVQTGLVANGRIEIIEGLNDGDRIVVVGQAGLRDGSPVQVVNPPEANAGTAAVSSADGRDES